MDQALAQEDKFRQLGLTLPKMLAVPSVVVRTHMTATVMKRFALSSEAAAKLLLFPHPLPLPAITFHLTWHRRNDASRAQAWFSALIS